MLTAFLGRDTSYDGLVYGAVTTTCGFNLQRCSPGPPAERAAGVSPLSGRSGAATS